MRADASSYDGRSLPPIKKGLQLFEKLSLAFGLQLLTQSIERTGCEGFRPPNIEQTFRTRVVCACGVVKRFRRLLIERNDFEITAAFDRSVTVPIDPRGNFSLMRAGMTEICHAVDPCARRLWFARRMRKMIA